MLSVGKRDGSKGLGFGGEVDDTELEEGEACSYLDDERMVDPDIALAYLDEKLQNVLGHFQKDFEGGVSAENLGAKFGGYGSFLPTYQWSPVCSHTRTPKVENHALRSPSNLPPEGGFQNNPTEESASRPAHCSDISSTRTLSAIKSLTTCDPLKLEAGTECGQAEELTCRAKTSRKSTLPDQKKLRVRIRVGSDILSTQTKAELYSGLGLAASSSASFEDSPESKGWSRKHHDAPDESPNSIIHTMTSFPLEGSRILSPLTENLAYLTGNKKSLRKQQLEQESASGSETKESLNLSNGPVSRNKGKSSVSKNKKSSTINGVPLEFGNSCTKIVGSTISKIPKEARNETFSCDRMISEALKLPLLYTIDGTASDFPKTNAETSEVILGSSKATLSFPSSKVRPSDMNCHNDWAVEKPTGEVGSAGKLRENSTEILYTLKNPLIRMGGKNSKSPFSENPSEVVKAVEKEQITHTLKSDMKDGNQALEIMSAAKDTTSSEGKNMLKVAIGHDITDEAVKGKARNGTPSGSIQEKRKSQVSVHKAENRKLHIDVRNSRDRCRDIFRDQKSEHEEKKLQSLVFSSVCGSKDSQPTHNGKITLKKKMKEEASGKKIDKPIISKSHFNASTSPPGNRAMPDAAAPVAPVMKDNWVCCDNCQTWRLLPVGRLPKSLPKKWVCSMLDWLPGMNRCDIEEDETTKALISLYQASAPESSKSALGLADGSTYAPIPLPSDIESPSRTKNMQSAVKSRRLNDVNYSPAVTKLDNSHQKQFSDLGVEKKNKSSKDELRLHERSSDEGKTESLKINKKKRAGQDFTRASKKLKNGYPTDEGKISQNDIVALKNRGRGARSVSPFLVTSRDNNGSSGVITYKNHIADEINNSKTSMQYIDQISRSVEDSFEKRNGDPKENSNKKRKIKRHQESRYSDSVHSAGLKDEERKNEQNGRLSHQSESNRKSDAERGYQDSESILFRGSMEDLEPAKRDLALTHPAIEAISISSKISSSRDSKANLKDIKGSPVESVTSSPSRSRRNARHASNGRRVFDNECPPNGFGLSVSPRSRSNHEHEVDGRRGSAGHANYDNGRMGEALVFPDEVTKFSGGKSVASEELPDNRKVTKVANAIGNYSDEACHNSHSILNVSLLDNEGSSMRARDVKRKSKSGSDKSDASNLFDSSQDQIHTHGNKLMATALEKLEKKHVIIIQSENGREGARVKSSTSLGKNAKHGIFPSLSAGQRVLVEELEGTLSSFPSEKVDLPETNLLIGKSEPRSPFVGRTSTGNDHTRNISGSQGQNEMDNTTADAINQNEVLPTMLRHQTPTGHASKDLSAPSPARRDSHCRSAANAVKEAKSLKHVADRLKSSGSNAESIGLYFQAALKFLLGASLLESSTSDSRHGDVIQSAQMYSSTAKLCEFCAHEFEKAQDMASAALAYKCTEVAYMRVVYSSHSIANMDRHELQAALQMAPPEESPSSSSSDVDNMNNAVNGEKVQLAKDGSSPQLAGSHVISARSRPSFSRLLKFAQDVSFAMEASRKSRSTLAAANVDLEKVQNEEGLTLIKRALDFNFQDVEGFLQLVRFGVEAISR